jgi:hypothetical protein
MKHEFRFRSRYATITPADVSGPGEQFAEEVLSGLLLRDANVPTKRRKGITTRMKTRRRRHVRFKGTAAGRRHPVPESGD